VQIYKHYAPKESTKKVPNIKSAKKRVLVIEKKNLRNRAHMSELKTTVKKFHGAIDVNDIALAEKLLPEVFSAFDECVTKGILHKNNAANKKSALAKRLSDVKSGKVQITIKKDNKTIAAEKAKAAKDARDAARAESKRLADEKKATAAAAESAAKEKKGLFGLGAKKAKPAKEEKEVKKEPAKKATATKAAPAKATAKKEETTKPPAKPKSTAKAPAEGKELAEEV